MRFFRHRCPKFRRGTTLVELMVAMLILAIVCVAWLEIIGIQSAKREARRREAVERLAGMMDAFMYVSKTGDIVINGDTLSLKADKNYAVSIAGNVLDVSMDSSTTEIHPVFDSNISPIGYQLSVVTTSKLPNASKFGGNWGSSTKWLIGKLYNDCEDIKNGHKPVFTLPVCLGL